MRTAKIDFSKLLVLTNFGANSHSYVAGSGYIHGCCMTIRNENDIYMAAFFFNWV